MELDNQLSLETNHHKMKEYLKTSIKLNNMNSKMKGSHFNH